VVDEESDEDNDKKANRIDKGKKGFKRFDNKKNFKNIFYSKEESCSSKTSNDSGVSDYDSKSENGDVGDE
ncbi:hypothetical protein KI387_036350, partial [Taxus chinensis]